MCKPSSALTDFSAFRIELSEENKEAQFLINLAKKTETANNHFWFYLAKCVHSKGERMVWKKHQKSKHGDGQFITEISIEIQCWDAAFAVIMTVKIITGNLVYISNKELSM